MANNASVSPRLTPAQRAALFAQMTRQHWQVLPAIAGAENARVSFTVPQARLLSKIRLLVTGTVTITKADSAVPEVAPHAPYSLIRNVSVDLNNGFHPFNLSGVAAYFYNLLRDEGSVIVPYVDTAANVSASRRRVALGKTSAASPGQANPLRFVLDLPVTLNDRDPIGLILAQEKSTVITVNIDFGTVNDLFPAQTGFTFALSNLVVTPMVETFSIPAVKEAYPDLTSLKLVHQKKQSVPGAGVTTVDLPTGMVYRKLLVYVEDASGGEADADLSGDFELVLNQSDIPYRIPPRLLAAINEEQYGITLPQGLYVFDFSYQGLANYGGSRDLIDTERLTEFWFRFQAAAAGNVTLIYEQLAKLT